MKKILLSVVAASTLTTISIAQSLKAKEEINKIKEVQIPEYKEKFKSLSPALSIDINVDYASFGNNDQSLSYAFNQMDQVYQQVQPLIQKNKTTKEEVEKKFKKLTIKMVDNVSKRAVTMNGNELIITSNDFYSNYFCCTELQNVIYTSDIKTKEETVKFKEVYTPEYKQKFAEISPKLANIEFNVDFSSFGNDETEVSYIFNQISQVVDGTKALATRSKAAMEEIEKNFKKITIIRVKDVAQRSAAIKGGELLIKSDSFYNNYFSGYNIETTLEQGL